MPNPNRPLISSAATGISGLVLALIRAPWWLTTMAFACFALGLLVTVIQSVFPQDSEHRLAWWRARWHHQQHHRTPRPASRRTRRTTAPGHDAPDSRGERPPTAAPRR